MKRKVVLAGTFFLLAGLVGCSSNPREALVTADIAVMNKAREQLRVVKEEVNKALEKSAKENKNLTDNDLKPAVNAAAKLKDVGKELQLLKERTDALKDSTTKEERDELVKKFKSRWEEASVALEKTQLEVDQAIKKAEERGPKEAVDELKKTLRLAEGEFAVLAKQ